MTRFITPVRLTRQARPVRDDAKNAASCAAARNRQTLPEAPRRSTRLHEAPRGSTRLHDAPRRSTRLHDASRGSTTLHDASRASTRLHDAPRGFTTLHEAPRGFTCLHVALRGFETERVRRDSGGGSARLGGAWAAASPPRAAPFAATGHGRSAARGGHVTADAETISATWLSRTSRGLPCLALFYIGTRREECRGALCDFCLVLARFVGIASINSVFRI